MRGITCKHGTEEGTVCLQCEIEALEAENAKLKAENAELKARIESVGKMDEVIAERSHFMYEEMAKRIGYETKLETRKDWKDIPDDSKNKQLMRIVAAEIRALIMETLIGNTPSIDWESRCAKLKADKEALRARIEEQREQLNEAKSTIMQLLEENIKFKKDM